MASSFLVQLNPLNRPRPARLRSVSDLALVNAQIAHAVTASNYLKDINANGIITVSDKLLASENVTKALPAP
jgi:hypothetical protein